MKKRNLQTLALNKRRISELHTIGGRNKETDACPTNSTCSCVTCRPTCELTIQPATEACEF